MVLAVAVALGAGFASWITRPLHTVEAAADRVAEGEFEARVPLEGPPELRRLARTFNEMVAKLDGLMRSQEQFVADASHELRTPLTALRLRLENLAGADNGDRSAELEAALDEVERLGALVDGLLTLARADRAAGTPVNLDVGAAVDERVGAWTPLAAEHGVRLEAIVDGDPQARVTSGRIEQVLDNLLANALEVAPRGTSIEITAAQSNDWVEIRVRDRGPGMREEEIAHAFDRFWRTGHAGSGFGLGLAIVRRLVEADGGEIELHPRPGGGLEAVVRLAAAR